jgi:hypothetical protein
MIEGAEAEATAVHAATNPDPVGKRSGRARLRRVLLVLIALLYVMSVPWYRATDAALSLQFGLPDWVAVAIACYVAVAILNAIAWRLTEIPDALEPVEDPDSNASRGAP